MSKNQKHALMACGIFVGAFLSVLITVSDPGLGWDEVFYFGSAPTYMQWLGHLGTDATRREVLEHFWETNPEHPPLAKLVMGVAIKVWGAAIGEHFAARLGVGFLFALLLVLVFLFMAHHFNAEVGLYAALSLWLMPRFFGHAHFAELDLPMALLWFASGAAFVQAAPGNRKWAVFSGLVFGLALLTKINALALPAVLLPWGIFYFRRKAIPACLALLLGLPVFLAGWPWLWFDTISHMRGYLATLQKRGFIPVYYFGRTTSADHPVPFHYPLVMTLATLPALTALAAVWGSIKPLKAFRKRRIEMFLLLNSVLILLSASAPSVPKYDGVRLFLPAFPFIACLAGIGLKQAREWLTKKLSSPGKARSILAVHFAWLVISLSWIHPFYLGFYGGFAGGVAGAHKLGMETNYWGDGVDYRALDFINNQAPKRARFVFFPYGRLAMIYLRSAKVIRPDLREVLIDREEWDLAVLTCRQGMFNAAAWKWYREGKPVFEHRRQGVPFCLIFDRSKSLPGRGEPYGHCTHALLRYTFRFRWQ